MIIIILTIFIYTTLLSNYYTTLLSNYMFCNYYFMFHFSAIITIKIPYIVARILNIVQIK